MRKILVLLLTTCYLLPTALSAQTLDILWHGDGYTPPFYKGRTLWSTESDITLVGVPIISGVNTNNLFYRWEQDGTVLGNYNAVGRRSLGFSDTLLGKEKEVTLAVISNNEVLSYTTINVRPTPPEALVYENSPLYGVLFNRELGTSYEMRERETTLSMFPLFFNTISNIGTGVRYEWRTNSGAVEDKSSVTYRVPEEASGTSRVTLSAKHGDRITQSVSRNLSVIFNFR